MVLHGQKTWVEISRAAVEQNIAALRVFLSPGVEFCAVVKSNAYGHGLQEMTTVLLEYSVSHFAVDSIDEAVFLRGQSKEATIFILNHTVPERLRDVVEIQAVQTVYDEETIIALAQYGTIERPAYVSLKIETGLYRQGVGPRGMMSILDVIARTQGKVVLLSVASHFANAEEPTHPTNEYQMLHFTSALEAIRAAGFAPKYSHIAGSAAAMTHVQSQETMVRYGIVLYGLWASKNHKRHVVLGRQNVELSPVLQWKTRIAQVKDVPPGGAIGYGSTFVANRPLRIAVISVGYADGYDRKLSNRGEVIVRGRKCPIVGNICMNVCMIDVSAVPSVAVDDVVTLIGRDGMHTVSADDLAAHIGTIHYEIISRINPLLPRVLW